MQKPAIAGLFHSGIGSELVVKAQARLKTPPKTSRIPASSSIPEWTSRSLFDAHCISTPEQAGSADMKMDQCRHPAQALVSTPSVKKGIIARKSQHTLRCALGCMAAVAVSGVGSPAPSMAADGRVGATSTGSTAITMIIPHRIRVMGFKDITLGSYSGTALTGSSPACVSHNGSGSYSVTMTSANGSFVLMSDTQAAAIPYTVAWAASNIPYDKATGAFPPDRTALADCTPVSNRLTVTVPPVGMDVAQPGAYADTLRVMVAPL